MREWRKNKKKFGFTKIENSVYHTKREKSQSKTKEEFPAQETERSVDMEYCCWWKQKIVCQKVSTQVNNAGLFQGLCLSNRLLLCYPPFHWRPILWKSRSWHRCSLILKPSFSSFSLFSLPQDPHRRYIFLRSAFSVIVLLQASAGEADCSRYYKSSIFSSATWDSMDGG